MIHRIDLDDETSELLHAHCVLTGLTDSELIGRLLGGYAPGLHEVLALVSAHPELREQGANLLQSFGPEPLADGIKRIAPHGYETLGMQFHRAVAQSIADAGMTHR